VLELDSGLSFDPARELEFFAALPEERAVCLIEAREAAAEPFFIRTQNLRRRLEKLLGPPERASKRLNLRAFASGIRYRLTATAFEQNFVYYRQARELFPGRHRKLLRIRPPVVLKLNLLNAYPRCYATRAIALDAGGQPAGGLYYGPFPSRKAADAFAERVLDLFKVRRCKIKIRRDPAFPGCIYSEMKMCLAPCFAGCSKEEYDVEVARLAAFLETRGASLRQTLESERDQASEALDFERAALTHKKLDKLDDALSGQAELPRRLEHLNAVVLVPVAGRQSIAAYEVRAGRILDPFLVSFGILRGEPRSAEQMLREALEGRRAEPRGELPEHLWLLARWFYSSPREGEIFFRREAWPYRRMMRACSRLLAGPGGG
jgi:excinuclease ABC subunit C